MLDRRPAASGRHQPRPRRAPAAVAGARGNCRHPTCQARPANHLGMAARPARPQAAQARRGGFGQQDAPRRVGHDDERQGVPATAGRRLNARLPRVQGSRKKMLIGRSDDPQNPCRVAASKVTLPFGNGSRNPSGPAAECRDTQAGHTAATAPHQNSFSSPPCTNRAVHTRPTPPQRPGAQHREASSSGADDSSRSAALHGRPLICAV
jgi:hypothetical protein